MKAAERLYCAHSDRTEPRSLCNSGKYSFADDQGTNALIQEGAKLVRNCNDILEELNLTASEQQLPMKEVITASETETLLLKQLGSEPVHIDQVCRNSGMPISEVSSNLTIMELKGLVRQVNAMSYVLAREARQEYKVKVE